MTGTTSDDPAIRAMRAREEGETFGMRSARYLLCCKLARAMGEKPPRLKSVVSPEADEFYVETMSRAVALLKMCRGPET